MRAERWEALSAWFSEWLAADAVNRERLRERLSRDSPELVDEADRLASSSGDLAGFLEMPALVLAAREIADEDPLLTSGAMVGPYSVVGLLARGGMGDVYKATDTRLRRDVALKVLARTKTGDAQRLQRFMHEARVTASLDHANIIRVYDVGTFDEHAYLVAELLDGETLRSRIARGRLEAAEARRIAIDVAKGLAAAHAAGLVHRDLKPDNIFLTRSGETKILDFGIAKLAQDETVADGFSTLTGVVVGTAGYLSPEQIRGGRIDGRADLFALGAVLFEMLTARRAFAREHVVDTLHAILYEPADESLAADTPPQLADVVMRLLQKSADARYRSADDVVRILERVDTSATLAPHIRIARRLSRARRSFVQSGRLRWTAAAVIVVMVALAFIRVAWREPTLRVAVFPFRSIPAAADDLLELGLADTLISRLGQLPEVEVLPLTATERRRGEDPIQAARQLGAHRIILASLQRDGRRVRGSAQIVSVADNKVLWTAPVDTDASSIFTIQDLIVRSVIEQFAPTMSADARNRLTQSGTRNNDAYQAYARGRGLVFNPMERHLKTASQLFEEAVKLDPGFADAWAALGSAYKRMPIAGAAAPRDAFPKAKAAAERALQLDANHAEAHAVLGTVAFWYEWDYRRAEQLLRRALDLHPSSADARLFLAHLLANIGRFEEALTEIRYARALDPMWALPRTHEGHFLFMSRRYADALEHLEDVVRLEPRYWPAHTIRLLPLLALERYEDVIRHAAAATELRRGAVGTQPLSGFQGYALARMGRVDDAQRLLAEMIAGEKDRRTTGPALVLHGLGRDAEAMEYLQAAVNAREQGVTLLAVYPWWDDLRGSAAFRNILSQANLVEVSDRIRR
jgi:serine/threonine-protein kinase